MDDKITNLLDVEQWKLTPYQVLVLGFASLIVGGALLLMTPMASAAGQSLSLIDALFTATSAVCVTGLVVVDTGTYFSLFGQLVIIGLIQAGGLGIMAMSTLMAIIIRKKINFRQRLIMQEALNQITVSGVVRLTQYIIKVTLLIEFIGGTILAIRWYQDFGVKGVYFGYWHAISSFCNAGFDLMGSVTGKFSSATAYVDDIVVNLVISLLIILGGIGFTVISELWTVRRFDRLSLHSKVVITTTLVLISFGAIVIFLLEYNNLNTLAGLSLQGKLLASYFQSVTTRTAGWNTIDLSKLTDATLFFMVILMFIGASPTSTGGGIKTSTAGVLAAAIWNLIRGRQDAEMFERRISQTIIYKAFSVMLISALLVIFITMMLSITEKQPFINLLFEATSAFGTVGLTTGITSSLTTSGKIWIIITMFAGRVGPVTLALALALKTRKGNVQYPEGKLIIG
ncbi:TrkH family potassium uptake protein [Sporomusa acidovorans]|uniref:Ktr system potassium uptake protein B n=1 Tax=Sporomusa acidovorans (strain ATCC 49682 / DSM 3132 / Mol) TaxID=1123286 RepID=A0ABZ3J4E3_SPOA4|nr:TrkH family potassium uptake protein [Sporomusa acidovorans]OZC20920.1 Ktr system potassium uptake protein B [Sporomusa acidovorans DSM 3132]SDE61053.1 trk system potassium uptake protein TrkH [Sporomusa acidovorans]